MCRLFGFRSVIQSQVHRSLRAAENALLVQSNRHPDGWGVAYYIDGSPHVTRSPTTAMEDQIFHHLSGVVASETVLAHVRRATVGKLSVLNCHPFQYGRWVFAHNGEIRRFAENRDRLLTEIPTRMRRFILGETDSEVMFFLFLTHLAAFGPLSGRFGLDEVTNALRSTIDMVRAFCDGPTEEEPSLLTIIVTDGVTMAGLQGGKELFWSTHKTRCSDRTNCPHLASHCEAPTSTGFVNHLVLSSEPLHGENVWNEMREGEIVGVDWRMKLHVSAPHRRSLQVYAKPA